MTLFDKIKSLGESDIIKSYIIKNKKIDILAGDFIKAVESIKEENDNVVGWIYTVKRSGFEISFKFLTKECIQLGIICAKCHNKGEIECTSCYGEGEIECSECGTCGDCLKCDGSGIISCPCGSDGTEEAFSCTIQLNQIEFSID